ncbi:unnamed protein product [Phaeothamnion confervicola]
MGSCSNLGELVAANDGEMARRRWHWRRHCYGGRRIAWLATGRVAMLAVLGMWVQSAGIHMPDAVFSESKLSWIETVAGKQVRWSPEELGRKEGEAGRSTLPDLALHPLSSVPRSWCLKKGENAAWCGAEADFGRMFPSRNGLAGYFVPYWQQPLPFVPNPTCDGSCRRLVESFILFCLRTSPENLFSPLPFVEAEFQQLPAAARTCSDASLNSFCLSLC